jgi:hypothetical protein
MNVLVSSAPLDNGFSDIVDEALEIQGAGRGECRVWSDGKVFARDWM